MAVLRALQDTKEGMSGRGVARVAGINHQSCANALGALELIGMIKRQGSGQSQLVRLNFDNQLVKHLILPLLKEERVFINTIQEEIKRAFQSVAKRIIVFGSVARRDSEPGSDIDVILFVSASEKAKTAIIVDKFSPQFKEKFGIRFSPLLHTVQEAKNHRKLSDPLIKNILKDGIDLLPLKSREFFHGKEKW